MKICWKGPHPQAIQDIDEFVSSSDLEKCIIKSLAHRWILCNGCRQPKTALNKYVGGFWCKRQQGMDFITGGSVIMDSYFSQKQWFEDKNFLLMDLFLTNKQLLASQDVNWWTGVVWITCGLLWCFYQLFGLSFWRHPFTAEHPLVSKWFNATFLQIWWRNAVIYISDGLRMSSFSKFSFFGWTIPLNVTYSQNRSLLKN